VNNHEDDEDHNDEYYESHVQTSSQRSLESIDISLEVGALGGGGGRKLVERANVVHRGS
jgi:hypothetical protein